MTRKRKNAGEGYGFMFHGAFTEKKDAVAKERKTKRAFIKGMPTKTGYRYIVMSPRENPPKRKRKPKAQVLKERLSAYQSYDRDKDLERKARGNPVFYDRGIQQYTAHRFDKTFGNIYASGHTKKQALTNLRNRLREYRKGGMIDAHRGYAQNPSELLVLGANPLEHNPRVGACRKCGETHNLVGGYCAKCKPGLHREYYGQQQKSNPITVPPGTEIIIRTNPEPRKNLYFGFGSAAPLSKAERTQTRRVHQGRVRAVAAEIGAERKRMRRSARASFKDKKKLENLFHEVYGANPEICGANVQGYPCTRKPGHRGPHLPQGATMRTRHRLRSAWKPREKNPSAEALREKFTGAPVTRVTVATEPHMPAGDYAQLGKLLILYVKPCRGGQVQMIEAEGRTLIVADESARQIYFVGGDQDVSSGLHVFGAIDRGNGLFELGHATRIDYQQRKEHVEHPESDLWRHDFGEESGVRPVVLFDARTKRLRLEGGEYRIEEAGIIN